MAADRKQKKTTRRPRNNNNATVEEDEPNRQPTQKKLATRRGNNFSPGALEQAHVFVKWAKDLGIDGLGNLFQHQLRTQRPPSRPAPSWEQNQDKNRYQDVVCLEETRIRLDKEQPQETDYIHANRISLPDHDRTYIMTQAPMDNTIIDFWRMVVQERAPVIVNLCKSVQYWPQNEGETRIFGRFSILLKKKDMEDRDRLGVYVLEILQEGCAESHITRLVHSTAFTDEGGIADTAKHVLRCIKKMFEADTVAKDLPYVLHCMAGIGRTGTVVLTDYTLYRIFTLAKSHSLLDTFVQLREQRASTIQKEAQFVQAVVAIALYCSLATRDPVVIGWTEDLEKNFKLKYGRN